MFLASNSGEDDTPLSTGVEDFGDVIISLSQARQSASPPTMASSHSSSFRFGCPSGSGSSCSVYFEGLPV